MRILEVSVAGFRHHGQAVTFDTDADRVEVTGDNATGKTTLAEAIVFGLYGTNLEGSPRVDNLLHPRAKEMTVAVRFMGSDGREHEVVRTRSRRGSELRLDGRKASQVDIEMAAAPSRYFLPAFWPTAVAGWPDREARDFFAALVPPPDPAAVLEALGPAYAELVTGLNLRDPEGTGKKLRQEIREAEQQIERARGQLEVLEQQAGEPLPEVTVPDRSAELEQLVAAYEALAVPDTRPLEAEARRLAEELARAKADLAALQGQMEDPADVTLTCPTCGQPLPEERQRQVRAAIEQRNAARKAQIDAVIRRGREARTRLKQLEVQIERLRPSGGDEQRRELARQIDVLRQHQQVYRLQVDRRALAERRREEARQAIERTRKAIADLEEQIRHSRHALDALAAYVAKRAELQVAALQQHLQRASIQLFDVVKSTGELRPVFRLCWDGRPYAVLSTSERIRCGLEVAGLIRAVTGLHVPVFVDNAESVTNLEPPAGVQVFVARVVPGSPLAVRPVREGAVSHV